MSRFEGVRGGGGSRGGRGIGGGVSRILLGHFHEVLIYFWNLAQSQSTGTLVG